MKSGRREGTGVGVPETPMSRVKFLKGEGSKTRVIERSTVDESVRRDWRPYQRWVET